MKRPHIRRGVSLLELISTMGVVGVTMMVVASVLTLSIRTYQQSLNTLATQRSVLDFERRFRDDCNNAERVDVAERQVSLVDQRGRSVVYEFASPGCTRKQQSETRDNDRVDRALMRWDTFRVNDIKVSQSGRLPLISLHATLEDSNQKFEIWVQANGK